MLIAVMLIKKDVIHLSTTDSKYRNFIEYLNGKNFRGWPFSQYFPGTNFPGREIISYFTI